MTEEPGLTIPETPRSLQEEWRRSHGRMTDAVAFELPMAGATIRELLEAEGQPHDDTAPLPVSAVSPELHQVVSEVLPPDGFHYYEADSGRGASGYAVALEVMGHVANAGGVLAMGAGAYRVTVGLYAALRRRLGRRPLVSLGSATHLAAADLVNRLGSDDFELHGWGDTRSNPPDASYSGDDQFYVIFERARVLFLYIVDAHGRVRYLGETARSTRENDQD